MLNSIVTGSRDDGAPTVVLCHGFGADAGDLAPLADELGCGDGVRWLFPQAPYQFQMSWSVGRAWFPRDPAGIESFLSGETFGALAALDPPALAQASTELSELMQHMGCDPSRTVVGGFSQGAMVAADTVLLMPELPAGLMLFSGSIIAAERWRSVARERAGELRKLRVAGYHGSDDPVLPFTAGQALSEVFQVAGARVEFQAFGGGHGIPGHIFPAVTKQLQEMLGLH